MELRIKVIKKFYTEHQEYFQNKFETTRLAERLEQLSVRKGLNDFAVEFIGSMNMMFITTVNSEGYPTVSYKGGDKGFVEVASRKKIIFPNYDGNGMFLTLGNISDTKKVGILFISFERPFRIRLEGVAKVILNEKRLKKFAGATALVEISIEKVWENCPRYIHRTDAMNTSKSIPLNKKSNIQAEWKRIDLLQDVLPSNIVNKNLKLGLIGADEWKKRVRDGDPSAE